MRNLKFDENPKRVLICMPVLRIGGTEIQTLNLVKVLVSIGYYVNVCCYYEYDKSMVSIYRSEGANTVLMGLKRSDGLLPLIRKLRTIFLKIQPKEFRPSIYFRMRYSLSYGICSFSIFLHFTDESAYIFFQASLPDRMYDGDIPLVIFSIDMAMFH